VHQQVNRRVFEKSNREAVAQYAWELAWEEFPNFDPQKACLGQFINYWTDKAILRSIPRGNQKIIPGELSETIPSPDRNPLQILVHREAVKSVLRNAFSDNSVPHANIAFGYHTPLEWEPRNIAENFWSVPLKSLTEKLANDLSAGYRIDKGELESILAPLNEALKAKGSENKSFEDFAPEAEIKSKYREEFGKDPDEQYTIYLKKVRTSKITNWAHDVLKELRGKRSNKVGCSQTKNKS
jgi:hypothetical protein